MSDVSCRAYTYFQAAEAAGLVRIDELLMGSALDRSVLEDPTKRVPWDAWAALCDRFVELSGDEGLAASGDLIVASDLGGALVRLNATILRPATLYRIAEFAGPMLYRTIRVDAEELESGQVRVRVHVPAPARPSLGWLSMAARIMPALPRYLGMPDAVAVLERLDDRHMHCLLTLPAGRTLLDRLWAVWTGLWQTNPLLEELDFHTRQLTTTYEALQRSERGFRDALDVLPEGVAIHREGRVVYANPPLQRWLGVGADAASVVHVDDREALDAILSGETHGPVELRFGAERWLKVTGLDLAFEEAPARMLFCVDVTARRRAEQEVDRSRQTLERLSDTIPDLVIRLGRDGTLVDFLAGADHDQPELLEDLRGQDIVAVARGFSGWMEPGFLDAGFTALEQAQASGVPKVATMRIRGPEPRHVEVRVIPGPDETMLLIRDVTRRTQLEEQVAISERMSSVGALAAGVAHEINNPLTYVSANVQFVLDDLDRMAAGESVDIATMREALVDAISGAGRVASIVKELKDFSKTGAPELQPVQLPDVVDSALKLVENQLRHRARVEQLVQSAPPALADPSKLVQVLVHLLTNAAQAIPTGHAAAQQVTVSVDRDAVGRPRLVVEDTGCGMESEVARRIFDPFFTTKGPSGTGLGMSVSHRIVTDLGGTIEVSSRPDVGTRVVVTLQAATPVPAERVVASTGSAASARHILVVDDDEPVGRALARMLGHHQVTLTASAGEALRVLEDQTPDLILCDVMMPEMSGMQLYQQLQERGLEDRVAFVSGGVFTDAARAFLDQTGAPVLFKPFRPQALRAHVDRLLR